MKMSFHNTFVVSVFVVFVCFGNLCLGFESCDWSKGSWVYDNSLPQYSNITCPFIRKAWDCQGNGRFDTKYQNYRWQPTGCNLARFDGKDFLERNRDKHIMFVGDSLSQNQYGSLTCLLYIAVPNLNYNVSESKRRLMITFTAIDYNLKVSVILNHFLVDIKPTIKGRMLDLDSIDSGKDWLGVDTLIFNTWHWWWYKKPAQPWDIVKDGDVQHIYDDIDRSYALKRGLGTWSRWVKANIDTNKTKVYFQGNSPDHYRGVEWGKPKTNCLYQTTPVMGSKYPGPVPKKDTDLIKSTLKILAVPVTLLDVTNLSLFRIDGHPSRYGQLGAAGIDCTNWCLSGVPDIWNQILYNFIISNN